MMYADNIVEQKPRRCCNPLWGKFLRVKLLNVTYVSQTAVESMIILFLLVQVPEFQCNTNPPDDDRGEYLYLGFYQTFLVPASLVSQIIWQFVSASITDGTEKHAHYVLCATLLGQIIFDAVMFFFAYSPWVILVLYVIRFSLVQQVGNSAGKIFKMRVELVLKLSPEQQLECYNHVAIISDFGGRMWVVGGVYTLILVLAKFAKFSFIWTRNIFFISLGITDILAFLCVVTMRRSYYLPVEEEQSLVAAASAVEQVEQSPTAMYLHDPALANRNPVVRFFIFLGRCVKSFYRNKLLFCINFQVWIIVLLFAFVNLVIRFSVSNVGAIGDNTPDGFCRGSLLVLVETQLYTEISRMIGAMIFTSILSNVTALYFYSHWTPFFAVLLTGCNVLLFFTNAVGPTVGSLTLAFINIVIYLSQVMASNLSGVVVDPAMVGFLFGLQGSVMQILGLVPLGLDNLFKTILGEDKDIGNLAVFQLLVGVSAIFGIFFSRKYRKLLKGINSSDIDEFGMEVKANCVQRWIFGRGR